MVKIISDSSSLYSIEQAKANNLEITPLSVTINNVTYKEYEEIQIEEFIDIINEGHIPVSSQPSIGEVIELYNKYPNDEIINICMADGLSGTYNSACTAKHLVENSDRIDVVNSKTLCGPQRYLVDLAVKLAEMDKPKKEILEELHKLMETSQSYLIPKDFDFLVRGGRLSHLAGRIGALINLVPVMMLSEERSKLTKFTAKRTFNKAVSKICEDLIKLGVDSSFKIYISHACIEELANTAKKIIENNIENADIEIKKLGPAFTTQGGPGCIAIQMIKKHSILG